MKPIRNDGITREIKDAIILIAISNQIPIYWPNTTWYFEYFKESEKNIIKRKISSIFVETNADIPNTNKYPKSTIK
jgi:hypothetical protein